MVCDCCGRKKKLFESFARIKEDNISINLCIDCNDLMYKIRDAYDEENDDEYNNLVTQIETKSIKANQVFLRWKESFLQQLSHRRI